MNSAGLVLTWDGRLDNRDDVIRSLHPGSRSLSTDADIVFAAYEQQATNCFRKLIGDWAITVWDPSEQSLILARDFLGARHLFYNLEAKRVTWSTVLDPLVLLAGRPFDISEEFIAGYLSTYPETHVTPFVGINAVPASTFVQIQCGHTRTCEYWRFDPSHRTHYRTDAEYEECFRDVLAAAVRRRLRSSSPVLAELSGGMDSTSIVCVADAVIATGKAECPRLDTVSYFDDNEPNWNERPYFALVEKKRGREGYHIEVAGCQGALQPPDSDCFFALPDYDQRALNGMQEVRRCLERSQSRVMLSGIGGDEFLGGVPSSVAELQDLFARFNWLKMTRQLSSWSRQKRTPWVHLLFEAIEEFLPQGLRRLYRKPRVAPWLHPDFIKRNIAAFWADLKRVRFFGEIPSFQSNINTLNHLRRQFNCSHLTQLAHYRMSYPFTDRDLLTFLFSVPREQIVRSGYRRSLMRRALANLVPAEIFARKRKAYVARHPLVLLQAAHPSIKTLLQSPLIVEYTWMMEAEISANLESIRQGHSEYLVPLLRTLKLELWLQTLKARGLLHSAPTRSQTIFNVPGAWAAVSEAAERNLGL
jgi:asparagine synthase (glutamine-hydrolysing)